MIIIYTTEQMLYSRCIHDVFNVSPHISTQVNDLRLPHDICNNNNDNTYHDDDNHNSACSHGERNTVTHSLGQPPVTGSCER